MSSTHSPLRSIALVALVTLGTQIVAPIFQNVYADNTMYYVDATGGSDANDGLSEGGAWQSFTNINVGGFLPGDQILFKCGESWAEQLIVQDSGNAGNPITFGSFGAGCDGSNDPAISITGQAQIVESGSVSNVIIRDFDLSAGDIAGNLVDFTGNGDNVTLSGLTLSNPNGNCMRFVDTDNIYITGNNFSNCTSGVNLGSMSGTISGNAFSNMGADPTITMSLLSVGTRTVSDNTFSSIGGTAIQFGQNANVSHNIITSACTGLDDCAAITNVDQDIGNFDLDLAATVSENFITTVGTGVTFTTYHQDGIRLDNLSRGVQVTGNTISGAQRAIAVKNGRFHTISNNTLYNPRTYAIHIFEDSTSGSGEVVESNTISNNTILTYNPDYSMVRIEDMVNNLGTLATLSGNKFLNTYKPKLPIIEVLSQEGDSVQVDKDTLTLVDATATNFTYFGYKAYTSTGVYSGANLITNGAFGADITGWSTDVLTLSHNAGSGTLSAAQAGIDPIGTLASNTFSVATNGVYEVSGWVKNVTNTEGHTIKVRLENSVGTLYVDREFDVVATATGTTFKAYVKANTDAVDAQLDFVLSNPGSDAEFDNIVVRQVAGLTYNSRNNEAILVSNTGSSAASKYCPGLPFCSQYVNDVNTSLGDWTSNPLPVNAYSSKIVFWNAATQIQNRPTGSLVPSAGSVGNGVPISLTWTTSNSSSQHLAGTTYTGAFDYTVATSGSMSLIPPNNGTTTFSFYATNDIGTSLYTADVVTSNTAPVHDPAFATGTEDTLSITGVVTATDVNSGGTINYQLFDAPTHGTVIDFQSSGSFDYRPNPDFCGVETFTFLATDFWGLGDAMSPGLVTVNVLCTNDTPVAIDDTLGGVGGVTGLLDVILNDTDPDSPYAGATAQGGVPQVFTITGLTQPTNGIVSVSGSYVEFTPDAPYYGPDSFTYMIEDQSGALSNVATVNLNVTPGMNLPPEVSGASFNTNEDTQLVDYLSGSDINGDTLTFSASTLPTNGTLVIVGSGFTYTPDAEYNGSDSFVFFVNDGILDSSGATVNITVNAVEDLPVVVTDTVNIEMQTPTLIDIMVNDYDADNLSPTPANQGLTITGYTLPTNGDLTVVGDQFQYTGTSGYLGADSFDYIVADANGNISNTGTVNITVSTTNQFPVADSGAFTIPEDTLLVSTLSGSDPDLSPVTFVLNTDVTNGTLTLSSTGGFTYISDLDYNGSDSFTYHVSDGVLPSSVQTVTIDVTPVNDLPVAADDNETGTEDTPSVFTPMDNDSDPDTGDTFSLYTIISGPSNGAGSISGTTIEYTPTADYCGADAVLYQIIDQSGAISGAGTMNINVTCTNDDPTVTDSLYTTLGNIPTNSGNVLTASLTGVDIDGDTLNYVVGTDVTNGTLVVSGTGYMTYTPDLGFSGSDSFTYTVSDGIITTADATVSITVNANGLNLPPTANSDSFTTDEDTLLSSSVTGTDPESAPLTFVLDTDVTQGTLSLLSDGSFTYTPDANYHGTDSFVFHVNDGVNDSSGATVNITITSVNDAPTATNDTANGTEDTVLNVVPLTNDTDVDVGDVLTLGGFTQGTSGTVAASGTTALVYTPDADACGADSISYSVQDLSGALSNTGTITVNITCVNDIPVASDETTATGTEDTAITISVLANDTDIEDGTPVSIANLTQPSAGGTVGIVGANAVFSPTANYCGVTPITFTYQARDSASALSNVATVTIPAINCVNDIPVTQSASYTMTGNIVTNSGTIDGSGNLIGYAETSNILIGSVTATDVEGSSLSFTLSTLPATGTASLTSTGYFDYIPALGFVGSDSFTVTSDDGTANSTPATITVCVISPNTSVARPSCAPALPTPTPVTTVGPGGGGGGASPAAGYYGGAYIGAVSNGTDNALTSQLYLTRNPLSQGATDTQYRPEGSVTPDTPVSPSPSQITRTSEATKDALLSIISNVVETAKMTGTSTSEGARTIRSAGSTILTKILSSVIPDEEKINEIDSTIESISLIDEGSTTIRESLTLQRLIRVFYIKRAKLIEILGEIMSE